MGGAKGRFQPFLRFWVAVGPDFAFPEAKAFQPFLRFWMEVYKLLIIRAPFTKMFQPFLRFWLLQERKHESHCEDISVSTLLEILEREIASRVFAVAAVEL